MRVVMPQIMYQKASALQGLKILQQASIHRANQAASCSSCSKPGTRYGSVRREQTCQHGLLNSALHSSALDDRAGPRPEKYRLYHQARRGFAVRAKASDTTKQQAGQATPVTSLHEQVSLPGHPRFEGTDLLVPATLHNP